MTSTASNCFKGLKAAGMGVSMLVAAVLAGPASEMEVWQKLVKEAGIRIEQ